MAISLKASKQGLELVDLARKKKKWTKRAASWYQTALVGEAALKKFWQRIPIVQENFERICQAVGIEDWEQIVDNSPTQASYIEFSTYDEGWVGRESLINDLRDKVLRSCRVLLLVGITGIGKTALAERLVEELRGDWIELRENFEKQEAVPNFAQVAIQWMEKWEENLPLDERKPEQLLGRLVKRLRENQHLILLDSLEYLLTGNEEDGWGDFTDEWWGKLFVSLLSESFCQSRLILTSQDFPAELERECDRYKNLWHYQLLKGLETSEQVELFQKANLDGDLESPHNPLRLIGEVYDGHPLALRVIAGEIAESWHRNVQAYWKKYRREIEEVKEALDAARKEGIVEGKEDRWQLSSYTVALRRRVKKRLETTFERLKNDVYDAYFLLCTASVYRGEVQESFWLSNLEDEGYTEEQQKAAMQALRDRYLVEDRDINHEDERLVGQHNLIRDVAINHRLKLPEN